MLTAKPAHLERLAVVRVMRLEPPLAVVANLARLALQLAAYKRFVEQRSSTRSRGIVDPVAALAVVGAHLLETALTGCLLALTLPLSVAGTPVPLAHVLGAL